MSDIDTVTVDSLKVLDPTRPIREADIGDGGGGPRKPHQREMKPLNRHPYVRGGLSWGDRSYRLAYESL